MASVTSPFAMNMGHAAGLGGFNEDDDDDDFVLEDAGFFGEPSACDAQRALNELGMHPSPPKARRYIDEDDIPFDLDQVLDMEEEQMQEEEIPSDIEEEIDDILESNGLLQEVSPLPASKGAPTPAQINLIANTAVSHIDDSIVKSSRDTSKPAQVATNLDYAEKSTASTSHHFSTPAPIADDIDDNIGLNGLPKYIASGTATATLLDGTMIRFARKRRMKGWKPKPAHYGAGATGLLSQPVHRIVDRIEAMSALKVVEDLERGIQPARQKKAVTTEIWQERYRPQRFTDLVGEERTHRDVLRWLKEWDACVFGRKAHLRKKWKQQQDSGEGPIYTDKWSRPRERILLLGGPAGMGKTTLARVAAKQCGYLVHELNASDDRSSATVEDRVRNALESKSLNQQTDLPTCLVLDEVDGATGGQGEEGGGFIKALIKLIESGAGLKSGKKGSKKNRPLLRPIICICNDPYSPNLRALRPFSRLVRVGRPSTPLLVGRLRRICELENIVTDSKGLNTLIDSCQGDIRSCLNVLQLIQSDTGGLTGESLKKKDELDQRLASAMAMKDGNSSTHQIWSQLFQSLTTKEKAQKRYHGKENGGEEHGEGSSLVASILNNGEMDKVLAGCFGHYPMLKLVDEGWWRFKKMHDWIYWYEHLNKKSWEVGAQTEMWTYLPWSFVGWKQLFSNTANELPEYPREDYQNHLKRAAFDEVTNDLVSCLPASTRSHFNNLTVVTELGPLLVTLLSPDLKLINSQIVRPEERCTLTSIVEIMQHYNLNFIMDKNEQDQAYYRLEPPLEVFVNFEGKKSQTVGPAKFQLRQLIVGELHTARVKARKIESGKEEKGTKPTMVGQGFKEAYAKKVEMDSNNNNGQKTRVALDFFGRPVVPKVIKQSPLPKPDLPESILGRRKEKENDEQELYKRSKLKVFYNFHEGYSNAVRKPIKMSSLLL